MLIHRDQTRSTVVLAGVMTYTNLGEKTWGKNRNRAVNDSVLYAYFKKFREFKQLIL